METISYEMIENLPTGIAFQIESIEFVTVTITNLSVYLCTMWHMVGWYTLVSLPQWFTEDDADLINFSEEDVYFLKVDNGNVIFVDLEYLTEENIDIPW